MTTKLPEISLALAVLAGASVEDSKINAALDCLADRLLERMQIRGDIRSTDESRCLSLRDSARLKKVRTAVVCAALKLPATHPGYLQGQMSGSCAGAVKGTRWKIPVANLNAWCRADGPRHAADAILHGETHA